MSSAPPIPGLAGIEHVGLMVPDLESASAFFAAVVGAEALYDIGPFAGPEDWMAGHLAGSSGAHIHRLRMIRIANGPAVELIELTRTDGRPGPVEQTPGGWHIAFYVEDMEAALVAIRAHGCTILSGPVEMTQGPSAGMTWLYFKAPWGQQLELVSYPGGIAAYKARKLEVWRPK